MAEHFLLLARQRVQLMRKVVRQQLNMSKDGNPIDY
jgi:hypothetical protein